MSSAVVVGAGLGGLSAAIRLASKGWRVAGYDKTSQPGGRMSTVSVDGHTWDCGPFPGHQPLRPARCRRHQDKDQGNLGWTSTGRAAGP